MPTELVVVGAGGFGRETLDVIEAHNVRADEETRLIVTGVVDDAPSPVNLARLTARGYAHLGGVSDLLESRPAGSYVLGVGSPSVKRALAALLDERGWRAATILHPSASIGSVASIGPGVVVCGGVQLSTNTVLGRHVHLNPNATIGHDAVLDDYVSVNPGAIVSGEVHVGAEVLVGAGSVVLQGLLVGERALIGASACVTRDVPAGETVIGIPARPIGARASS